MPGHGYTGKSEAELAFPRVSWTCVNAARGLAAPACHVHGSTVFHHRPPVPVTAGRDVPPQKNPHGRTTNFQTNCFRFVFFFFNLSGVSSLQETATGDWCNTKLRDSDLMKRGGLES